MKTLLFLLGIGLIMASPAAEAGPAKPPPPIQVEFEAKFIMVSLSNAKRLGLTPSLEEPDSKWRNVLSPAELEKLMQAGETGKSLDFLSAPRVTTKSGQRAVIEIIREFRYPTAFEDDHGRLTPTAFETRNMGVSLEVEGDVAPGNLIDVTATPTLTEFDRFIRYDGGTIQTKPGPAAASSTSWFLQPVFDAIRIPVNATLRPDETLIMGGFPRLGSGIPFEFDPTKTLSGGQEKADVPAEPKLLFVTLTAHIFKNIAGTNIEDAKIKPGDPVEINSQLIGVARHRLPAGIEMLIEHPSTRLTDYRAIQPSASYQQPGQSHSEKPVSAPPKPSPMWLVAVYSADQAVLIRNALQQASIDNFSNGPQEVISAKDQYAVEATGLLRYPAAPKGKASDAKSETSETAATEQISLQVRINPEATLDGSIDLVLSANVTVFPKSEGNKSVGAHAEAAETQWTSQRGAVPNRSNLFGKAGASSLTIYSGAMVLLAASSPEEPDRLQILLITAKGAGDGRDKPAKSVDSKYDPTDPQKLPRAIPAKDKPGFVVSPYAPDAGLIDVRGFPPGTEVLCPYSHKIFLVP